MSLQVTPVTIQSQVVTKMRDAILTGRFKPGERLREASLCKMMNVSRTSIREALRRLEGERLVVIVPNKGPSVAEITWPIADEIFGVRALLETEAAALCATRATPAEIRQMELALNSYAKATASGSAADRLAATSRFYNVLLAGCGNQIIKEVLEGMHARISLLRFRSMSIPGRSQVSHGEMLRMLAALRSGDANASRRAALEHIEAARQAAFEFFNPSRQDKAPKPVERRQRA